MSAAVVGAKGQIVIPAGIRAELGVKAGSRVEFVKTEDGWLFRPATLSITAPKGSLKKSHKPVSVEDMNQAIRRGAGRQKPDGI